MSPEQLRPLSQLLEVEQTAVTPGQRSILSRIINTFEIPGRICDSFNFRLSDGTEIFPASASHIIIEDWKRHLSEDDQPYFEALLRNLQDLQGDGRIPRDIFIHAKGIADVIRGYRLKMVNSEIVEKNIRLLLVAQCSTSWMKDIFQVDPPERKEERTTLAQKCFLFAVWCYLPSV